MYWNSRAFRFLYSGKLLGKAAARAYKNNASRSSQQGPRVRGY